MNLQQIALVLFTATMVYAAPEQRSAIRHVDFKNSGYPRGGQEGVPSTWRWIRTSGKESFRMVDGEHRFVNPNGPDYDGAQGPPIITFESVSYGDIDGDGSEEAAVRTNYSGGGTANWDYLYIYKLEHDKPKLLALLRSGSRADGGLIRVSIDKGLLVLEFQDATRQVGDCCSEGFIRVHYKWHQGRFIETGRRERGDLKLNIQ